jgi:hypothetical protein
MNKLFTVEVSEEMVEIHLNDEGIDFLIDRLKSLKNRKNDHDHLMTQDWGGNEITNNKQNLNDRFKLMHHLKLIYWNDSKILE